MPVRNLLHISKLEEFKAWLDRERIQHRPGKGQWQRLQVYVDLPVGQNLYPVAGWRVVFERAEMKEHFSISDDLIPIVKRFIADTEKKGRAC